MFLYHASRVHDVLYRVFRSRHHAVCVYHGSSDSDADCCWDEWYFENVGEDVVSLLYCCVGSCGGLQCSCWNTVRHFVFDKYVLGCSGNPCGDTGNPCGEMGKSKGAVEEEEEGIRYE